MITKKKSQFKKKAIKNATLYLGDCLEVMKQMPKNSVDAVVTDPPYGIKFMSKKWDYDVPSIEIWKEALRVLKPGGHLLAFGGSRTYHRMVINVEDAGFEIRDQIMWIYGSGFPKSLNVSKAIDKEAGAKRKVVGVAKGAGTSKTNSLGVFNPEYQETAGPVTPEAKQWDGWGTALKPAHEPICVARKPITEKTIAKNILKYGTGGINIDDCRVSTDDKIQCQRGITKNKNVYGDYKESYDYKGRQYKKTGTGRWPANLIHDGGPEVEKAFAKAPKVQPCGSPKKTKHTTGMFNVGTPGKIYKDLGTPSRFFYAAKASKSERNVGLEDSKHYSPGEMTDRKEGSAGLNNPRAGAGRTGGSKNSHPTVKPAALMGYLVRLVTPPGGTVLDNFMGSGSTGIAVWNEGFDFIGIEKQKEDFNTACKRIRAAQKHKLGR